MTFMDQAKIWCGFEFEAEDVRYQYLPPISQKIDCSMSWLCLISNIDVQISNKEEGRRWLHPYIGGQTYWYKKEG